MAKQGKTTEIPSSPGGANLAPTAQEMPHAEKPAQEISQEDMDVLLAAGGEAAGAQAGKIDPVQQDPGRQTAAAINPTAAVAQYDFPSLGPQSPPVMDAKRVSMLSDVNLRVRIELGRTKMLVEDVLKLGKDSVVELDKLAGDPVDVYANDRLVARGEVLVLDDSFCVRISEVVSRDPHRIIR